MAHTAARPILVLGAGVSGLTTAIVLAESGHDVRIWSREVSPHTTSDAAGALWFPYLCGPVGIVDRWAAISLATFRQLAATTPESGCREIHADMVFDGEAPTPSWCEVVSGFTSRPLDPGAATTNGYAHAHSFNVPIIDVGRYMPYLMRRAAAAAVAIERRNVTDVAQALTAAPVVVNCTGLGSRELMDDRSLHPIRGQTVRARGRLRSDALIDDEAHNRLAYIFPRIDDTVLGGTDQDGDWRTEPDAADTAAILDRCRALDPTLGPIDIASVSVGLRPARPTVRLEAEEYGDRWLVHNYGHGGGGFTLSWGCARNVAALIGRIVGEA